MPSPFRSPLKAAILTSETVTPSDRLVVERVLGAPAVIEYGAAEVGPIAYSVPGRDGLRVFWNSFIVQVADDGRALITSIGDKLFPLINYDIGDVIDGGEQGAAALLEFSAVSGRTADVIRIGTRSGGAHEVIGRFLVHVLKSHPDVLAIQLRQRDSALLRAPAE